MNEVYGNTGVTYVNVEVHVDLHVEKIDCYQHKRAKSTRGLDGISSATDVRLYS